MQNQDNPAAGDDGPAGEEEDLFCHVKRMIKLWLNQNKKQRRKYDESGGNLAGEWGSSGVDGPAGEEEEKPFLFVPDEVVESIIAKMPFPHLLKARVLSNSWNDKFSLPREDLLPEDLTSFQKEISSVSHKWPSFCPVFLNRRGLRGFDRASSQWKSLFPSWQLSILDSYPSFDVDSSSYPTFDADSTRFSVAGSVILVSALHRTRSGTQHIGFVKNVITGRVTKLDLDQGDEQSFSVALALREEPSLVTRLLPGDSNASYRVFQSQRIWNKPLRRMELRTGIYDSKVGGWSNAVSQFSNEGLPHFIGNSSHPLWKRDVYLHGRLYCLSMAANVFETNLILCVNNVDSDKTWTAIDLSFSDDIDYRMIGSAALVLCGEKVMVVIYTDHIFTGESELYIYELDTQVLGSKKLLVSRHILLPEDSTREEPPSEEPPSVEPPSEAPSRIRVASDHDFIYFDGYNFRNPVIAYNVHSGEWSTLPPFAYYRGSEDEEFHSGDERDIPPFSFQTGSRYEEFHTVLLGSPFTPGLNPFAIVEQNDVGPLQLLRRVMLGPECTLEPCLAAVKRSDACP